MNIKNGWIYSQKKDLLVFLGPLTLGLVLVFLLENLDANETAKKPLWFKLLFSVAIDMAHTWSTLFRVGKDKYFQKMRPKVFYGVPVASFLILFVSLCIGFWPFIYVITYGAIFHFIRQQNGWVSLTIHRGGKISSLDYYLDHVMTYNCTIYPIIYWHLFLGQKMGWWISGGFFSGLFPLGKAEFFQSLHFGIIIFYVLRQLFKSFRGDQINFAKYLIILCTWLGWYLPIVIFESPIAVAAITVGCHGIQYFFVMDRWGKKQLLEGRKEWKFFHQSLIPLRWLAILTVVALIHLIFVDRLLNPEYDLFNFLPVVELPMMLRMLVSALLFSVAFSHYLYDMFIWKLKDPHHHV